MPSERAQIEVLVVESALADTTLIEIAFRAAGLISGFHAVIAGADTLAYVRGEGKYAGVPVPDLIFLDLSQATVSGIEVLRELKSTPSLLHIPVVVASSSEDPEVVRAVYALHANCFIRKPLDLVQFLRFVETCYQFWGSVVTLSPPNSASAHA